MIWQASNKSEQVKEAIEFMKDIEFVFYHPGHIKIGNNVRIARGMGFRYKVKYCNGCFKMYVQ